MLLGKIDPDDLGRGIGTFLKEAKVLTPLLIEITVAQAEEEGEGDLAQMLDESLIEIQSGGTMVPTYLIPDWTDGQLDVVATSVLKGYDEECKQRQPFLDALETLNAVHCFRPNPDSVDGKKGDLLFCFELGEDDPEMKDYHEVMSDHFSEEDGTRAKAQKVLDYVLSYRYHGSTPGIIRQWENELNDSKDSAKQFYVDQDFVYEEALSPNEKTDKLGISALLDGWTLTNVHVRLLTWSWNDTYVRVHEVHFEHESGKKFFFSEDELAGNDEPEEHKSSLAAKWRDVGGSNDRLFYYPQQEIAQQMALLLAAQEYLAARFKDENTIYDTAWQQMSWLANNLDEIWEEHFQEEEEEPLAHVA